MTDTGLLQSCEMFISVHRMDNNQSVVTVLPSMVNSINHEGWQYFSKSKSVKRSKGRLDH